ncbi:MAG: hypothetical protein ACRETH_12995 [Steroidobacteraceae bacterium]
MSSPTTDAIEAIAIAVEKGERDEARIRAYAEACVMLHRVHDGQVRAAVDMGLAVWRLVRAVVESRRSA